MADMGWPTRAAIVVPGVAALVSFGAQSVDLGVASTVAMQSAREVNAWRLSPAADTWRTVKDDLDYVLSRSPADPTARELLGVLETRGGSQPDNFSDARSRFEEALALRPTSPYTWANLAATKYRLGDTGKGFEAALVRSTELGPFEPEVQGAVALFGLAVWDDVTLATRRAVDRMVAAGMKRNPLDMLQIAERRGRLDIACGHIDRSPRRIGSKWAEICQSLEATS
jgi:hypothetical protein